MATTYRNTQLLWAPTRRSSELAKVAWSRKQVKLVWTYDGRDESNIVKKIFMYGSRRIKGDQRKNGWTA